MESPSRKAARWPAILFVAVTVLWTGTMIASLHWRFLDNFMVASRHGKMGLDYFPTPRAFKILLAGNNMFLTEISDYGPSEITMYCYHPAAAVAVGPWTATLPPWWGFGVFIGVSLLMLLWSARLLASLFEDPTAKAFTYFAMFCSIPVYVMLWKGQLHVFIVMAVSLVLVGLMRLEQEPERADRYLRWIQYGLLVSLLLKPIAIMMLPVLFALPETRRKLLLPLGIYAALSLVFLLVPRLNPGGYNGVHWLHVLNMSFRPNPVFKAVFPFEQHLMHHPEVYSLPMYLYRMGAGSATAVIAKLPVVAVAVMSLAPFVLSERSARIRTAIVAVALCILSQILCYYQAWEYHYTALLPLFPMMLWLWRKEPASKLRLILLGCFVVSLMVFVPTPFCLAPDNPDGSWAISTLQHVVPVILTFLGLFCYGTVVTWRSRRQTLIPAGLIRMSLPAVRLGGLLVAMLIAVMAAAWYTAPRRLSILPGEWTRDDWITHLEDIMGRPGVCPSTIARIHCGLGRCYASVQPDVALEHYHQALTIGPDSAQLRNDLGSGFFQLGEIDEAITNFQAALRLNPDFAEARFNFGRALSMKGREDEAIEQFQQAMNREPDLIGAYIALARLLAARQPDRATELYRRAARADPDSAEIQSEVAKGLFGLGKFVEAIEHYRRALAVVPGRPEIRNRLASALAANGQWDEAAAEFRRSLELDPGSADTHQGLAKVLVHERRFEEAIEQYRRALRIEPGNAQVRWSLGTALKRCGRLDEAITEYQRAVEIKPGFTEARNDLAAALREQGQMPDKANKPDGDTVGDPSR